MQADHLAKIDQLKFEIKNNKIKHHTLSKQTQTGTTIFLQTQLLKL